MHADASREFHEHHPVRAIRVIYDSNGVSWVVREVEQIQGSWRSLSLVFSSEGIMRRVRNYPPDWYDWTDAALIALAASKT